MAESATLRDVLESIKHIERSMVTKEEFNRMVESMEIMSHADTLKQIRASEEDIKAGRTRRVRSTSDML